MGLYEYLAVEVPCASLDGTRVTEALPSETYDDDAGLFAMQDPHETSIRAARPKETHDDFGLDDLAFRDEGTVDTRTTGETYDDDPGLEQLGYLRLATDRSSNTADTYDDRGFELLADIGVPSESTILTKVEAETYDDDSGLGGLPAT